MTRRGDGQCIVSTVLAVVSPLHLLRVQLPGEMQKGHQRGRGVVVVEICVCNNRIHGLNIVGLCSRTWTSFLFSEECSSLPRSIIRESAQ